MGYITVIAQSPWIYGNVNKPCPRAYALGLGLFTAINPCRLCNSYYVQCSESCVHIIMQVIWKQLYQQSSARDHGTLGFFRCKLNRVTVKTDVKKDVNATLDFFLTVVKGHLLAVACDINKLDSTINFPPSVIHGQARDKDKYIRSLSSQIVERCTLVDEAFTGENIVNTQDC